MIVVIAIHGSAIKFCKIAEGISDVYPKFSRIHEWDIAAGHLIIEESGGRIIETESRKTSCSIIRKTISSHRLSLSEQG